MARRDEMVQRVDERDLSPATQGADLSAVEGRPDGHWRDQAQARDAAGSDAQASPSAPGAGEQDDGAQTRSETDGSDHDAAASGDGESSSQAESAEASAGQDFDIQANPRVEVQAEWTDLDGATHSRDVSLGAEMSSQTTAAATVEAAQTATTMGQDGLGATSEIIGSMADATQTSPTDLARETVSQVASSVDDTVETVDQTTDAVTDTLESVTSNLGSGLDGAVGDAAGAVDGVTDALETTVSDVALVANALDDASLVDAALPVVGEAAPATEGGLLSSLFDPGQTPVDVADLAAPVVSGEPLDLIEDTPVLASEDGDDGGAGGLLGDVGGDSGLLGGDSDDDGLLGF